MPAPLSHDDDDAIDPTPGVSQPGVRSRLSLLAALVGSAITARGHDALREVELSGTQYVMLAVLDESEPGSQLELARLCGKAPGMVVGILDELEERGIVDRGRDPQDRRRSVVRLTASGRTVLAAADRVVAGVEAKLMSDLSAAERAELHDLLRRVDVSAPAPAAASR